MKKRILYYLAILTTLIYSIWRIGWSLPYAYGGIHMFFGSLLLTAEIIGFIEAGNYLKGMTKHDMPEAPDIREWEYPEVDIFIATYNEPESLLKKTINGCKNMDYPDKRKVHIYLCDDNDRTEMKELSERMGIGYFRRDNHRGAKAGNYNNALEHSFSPLVATFDADMIPMHDFLMTVVPYFFLDSYEKNEDGIWKEKAEKSKPIGFVQTPQSFYNADLFQYNLFSEKSVPNEQDFFFQSIQSGRNTANAVIYAGSNTVLSRKALEDAGGFYEDAITEDLATGVMIQTKGYQCYAIDDVHANGLAPTDIKALFKQRDRWARGCIQTFRQQRLLSTQNMDRKQKTAYIASLLYWYTPIRRVIFLLAPILYSVFGIRLLDCTAQEILIFWLPHYICYGVALSGLSGKIRTTRLSNIYETIMAFSLIPGILMETVGIKKEKFEVTGKVRKQDTLADTLKYAVPHILFSILSAVGLIRSIHRTFYYQTAGYAVIIFWLAANLYTLIMSIFFLTGRKYYRTSERYEASVPVTIKAGNMEIRTKTKDISEGGMSFVLEEPRYIADGEKLRIEVENEDGRYRAKTEGTIVHVLQFGRGWKYAVKYKPVNEEEELALDQIIYDRLPTLPSVVNQHSTFFEDIKNNIRKRMDDTVPSRRALPRVNVERVLLNRQGEKLMLKDFNYEYLRVVKKDGEYGGEETFTEPETGLVFHCEKDNILTDRMRKNSAVYQLRNIEDFIQNKEFPAILRKWNNAYFEETISQEKQKKQKINKSEYEFHEADYLEGI